MKTSRIKHTEDKQPSFLRRTLHLQHHRHTGKLLHHKHTSHRGLALVLLLAGLFVAYFLHISAQAGADPLTLYVTARNPAPIPTTPPVITQPATGYVTDTPTLTVSGTCPVITPQVSIAIVDNGTIIGSTPCDGSNNFTIIITLSQGQNTLVARSFTITDDSGPDSTPVLVTYTPPVPPAASLPTTGTNVGSTAPQSPAAIAPLLVTIDKPFITFGPAKAAALTGSITGGVTPYKIHIDWGDGSQNTYTKSTAGDIQFTHNYVGMHSYVTTMLVTDQSGQSVIRQYAAVTPYKAPITGNSITPPTSGGINLFAVYGIYLLLLAGLGGLWVHAHARPFEYARIPTHSHPAIGGRRRKTRRH